MSVSLRYHVGSLAFGALILTLIQIIRIILEYLDHKTRGKAGGRLGLPLTCYYYPIQTCNRSIIYVYVYVSLFL